MTSNTVKAEDLDFAEAWKPEPGDVISGEVTSISTRDGGYGQYPIIEIKTDDGEVRACHAFHTVLSNELARVAPQKGSRIAILYRGKEEREESPDFHSYRVKDLSETPHAFDWNGERKLATDGPVERFSEPIEKPSRGTEEDIPF